MGYNNSEINKTGGNSMKQTKEILREMNLFERKEYNGLDFGYDNLNQYVQVLPKSSIITLAGYPAMGRTNFSLNVALHLLKNNDCSLLYITKSEKSEFLMERLLSIDSNVPMRRINKDDLSKIQTVKLKQSIATLEELPLYINEVLDVKNQEECADDLIERFSKMTPDANNRIVIYDDYYGESHTIEKIRKKLKKYNVTLIIISKVFNDYNQKERELDLNNIEQYLINVSDLVATIHRPAYFESRIDDNSAYINILMSRHFKTATLKFIYDCNTLKFYEDGIVDDKLLHQIHMMADLFEDDIPF
jgi:replicative DNA helicase